MSEEAIDALIRAATVEEKVQEPGTQRGVEVAITCCRVPLTVAATAAATPQG